MPSCGRRNVADRAGQPERRLQRRRRRAPARRPSDPAASDCPSRAGPSTSPRLPVPHSWSISGWIQQHDQHADADAGGAQALAPRRPTTSRRPTRRRPTTVTITRRVGVREVGLHDQRCRARPRSARPPARRSTSPRTATAGRRTGAPSRTAAGRRSATTARASPRNSIVPAITQTTRLGPKSRRAEHHTATTHAALIERRTDRRCRGTATSS